jgi:L-fucose isomerase
MPESFELPVCPPQNRLRNSLPKIGIRPAIDGRRKGVRESLEDQTMNMARAAARLISDHIRHPSGAPVECVIADTCIGGVSEATLCAEKFAREGVGVSLTVTPCWCYGTETMDIDPLVPKAVWGFNGTERPGAVYLAAMLAGYTQKGLPAFGIYGRDVQDNDDTSIPEDVKEKILRFARCGLAVARMRGSSYLAIGSVSMGIAGSIVDQDFFQDYLGMRTESVDMTEITRRIDEKIFDPAEFEKALQWTRRYCKEGPDNNPEGMRRSREQLDKDWEFVVKMTMISRDLMVGNPRLEAIGYGEEALGHNALAAGFQGQRQWTDHFPNGDFMETILNSSFDWNGKRQPQRGGHVVRSSGDRDLANLFGCADLLESVRDSARNRLGAHRHGGKRVHSSDQFRFHNHGRNGKDEAKREARDETFLGNFAGRGRGLPGSDTLASGIDRLFPGRRILERFPHGGRHAGDHVQGQSCQGTGAGHSNCGGLHDRDSG